MKRIISSVLLGVLLLTLVAVPVLAAYYAYLTVEEEDGNAYEELAVICSRNITQLVDYDLMTSTGLDSRVLTGSAEALPHMLSEDKILFVTDLAAYEEKTLIFYLGATSLSSFPIVLGHDGYLTTPDDAELELTYVMELLVSGYFDSSLGVDKNILYKEDAYKVWISGADELSVAGLSAGDVEEWTMTYGSFTTGIHTVYVISNGLAAYLYIDNFEVAKDTENLYQSSNTQVYSAEGFTYYWPYARASFYAEGKYWAFYRKAASEDIFYKTSADGSAWSSEYTISAVGGDTNHGFGIWFRGDYMHIVYGARATGQDYVRYRRGDPASNSTISWSAAWQNIPLTSVDRIANEAQVAVDSSGYPYVLYQDQFSLTTRSYVTKSSTNDGTWVTAGGYPFEVVATTPYQHAESITAYPNSNKIYILYGQDNVSDSTVYLYGRYYNGTSWGGSGELVRDGTPYTVGGFNAVADDDDNLYIVWNEDDKVYLRIRYAGGTFGSVVEVAAGSSPSVAYNSNTDHVYIIYVVAGYVKAAVLTEAGLVTGYTLFNPGGTSGAHLSATPYGDHIGIMYKTTTGNTQHGYLQFPYVWNDNANNWTWMENNVMPYATDLVMGIDGETVLEYEPDSIILGTVMPDESGSSHPATITWGSNPSGVTASLAAFADEDEAGPPFEGTVPGLTAPPDVVGPTGQPGWTADIPSLVSHPLYPLVDVISGVTGIPAKLIWILGATLLVAAAMLISFRYAPHQLITVFIGGGLSAFFYGMEIYPFWVIFIFAVMGIAVIIGERSPTVS